MATPSSTRTQDGLRHPISSGLFSIAAGLRCADCSEPIRGFDLDIGADDKSFRIACLMCGHALVERRS
jgi:hypothetical protein